MSASTRLESLSGFWRVALAPRTASSRPLRALVIAKTPDEVLAWANRDHPDHYISSIELDVNIDMLVSLSADPRGVSGS